MGKMFVVLLVLCSSVGTITGIRLEGNGYTDILVAINPDVPENEILINRIKEMVIDGSKYLFQALDNKVFFKEVKILVPQEWKNGTYERAKTETYKKARIIIDNPHAAFDDDPYTLQTKGCGEESQHIHFTPNFLLNNKLLDVYGPRGRVFVHEWAHLRWGVFDEYDNKNPFYRRWSDKQIQPTRCSSDIKGTWYELQNGNPQPCRLNSANMLPTEKCQFFPDRAQNTNASIMFMQSIDSVNAFCQEKEHNHEAPNMQNKKCDGKATRTVIFQDSIDKDALRELLPLQSPPADPTFKILQRGPRAVCLVLDVSGSMSGSRIAQQKRAATLFLEQIVEDQAYVGIVTFSSTATVLKSLTLINGEKSRKDLVSKLPTTASGGTQICRGLLKGLEVLQGYTVGGEIIFLTDGEAGDNVQNCLNTAVTSGAIIHTIAFGPSADSTLVEMANLTDGRFIVASDSLLSNQLVDAFSSLTFSDGNPTKETIQLESIGKSTSDWFNGTLPIDQTVGNSTTFTIIYERSSPTVYIKSPSGLVYNQTHLTDTANTITLTIPGTAEPGDWKYSFLNKETRAQAITLTVTSRAAKDDVPPVMVNAEMDQLTNHGNKPMRVFAEVRQKYSPVLGANVWAFLESDTMHSETLQLLDNGAGADIFKNDGVYSRYFTNLKKGRYSLKVRVTHQNGIISSSSRYSSALYVPGYIENGEVKPNDPKPPVNVQPVEVGSFSRTATGESFEVTVTASTKFPPNKITDLSAEIQEDTVLLNWTAPGDDFDIGNATSYEIRWSTNLDMLRNNFSNTHLVNTSGLLPQEAGSDEQFSFLSDDPIPNGTTLFFAIQTEDKDLIRSDISNIAQVTKLTLSSLNPRPPGVSNEGVNLTAIVVSVCAVVIVACGIATITMCLVRRRKDIA